MDRDDVRSIVFQKMFMGNDFLSTYNVSEWKFFITIMNPKLEIFLSIKKSPINQVH